MKSYALYNNETILKLWVCEDNDGAHTLDKQFSKFNQGYNYTSFRNIAVKRCNSFFKSKVDFAKINVEGHEEEVLEGMKRNLKHIKYL